ncbi:MAG: hypothetical protein WC389_15940 [Lutibacter sp.]|jgi:hypothetical protein
MAFKAFDIKSEGLIDLALLLQQINDVALPFAMQNTLNEVARDTKMKNLAKSINEQFRMRRSSFFRANSGYKAYKAKDFGYNINKLKSEVGIVGAKKEHDKATSQVGNQETAKPIKRSINPLGEKLQTADNIDILGKKPEIYDSSKDSITPFAYLRSIQRAQRRGAGIIFAKYGRGTVRRVDKFERKKPTKYNPYKYRIKTTPIASYIKDGYVSLVRERPFLTNAVNLSLQNVQSIFEKNAQKQFERLRKS